MRLITLEILSFFNFEINTKYSLATIVIKRRSKAVEIYLTIS